MKILLLILMLITFSCSELDSKRWNLCKQEKDLLKGKYSSTVIFDFSLTQETQFENLQKQLDFNVCNGIHNLNAKFPITPEDTIETQIILERICEEDFSTLELGRVSYPSIQILLNGRSKILLENNSTSVDSLGSQLIAMSKSNFANSNMPNKPLAFQIKWDKETPVTFRKQIFKIVIDSYIRLVNDFAESFYKRSVCELEDSEIEELKQQYKMVVLLRDILPPVGIPEDFEIVPDTGEQEIEEVI